jgi:CBS domain containing-hemolysin-like protein
VIGVLMIILLILGNAFFVCAEFALVSARRSSIELRALSGSRFASITLNAMERVSIMLAGAQLGVTLCSLGLGALGEPYIAHYLQTPLQSIDFPEAVLHPLSFVVALAIMTYLHVVFGEMIPKNIALAGPDRAALTLVPMLAVIVRLLYPIVIGLNAAANFAARGLGVHPKSEVTSTFTRDEVAGFVEESHREGLLSEDEEQLISGSLRFDERSVRSVLLPFENLVMASTSQTPADIEELAGSTGYSRFPVQNSRKELVGYVHLKDVLDIPAEQRHQPLLRSEIRPLVQVRAHEPLRSALAIMQKSGAHLAEVISRGQSLGVATLEDVVEEFVGEIRDDSQRSKIIS